jgi:hypothetical protein
MFKRMLFADLKKKYFKSVDWLNFHKNPYVVRSELLHIEKNKSMCMTVLLEIWGRYRPPSRISTFSYQETS